MQPRFERHAAGRRDRGVRAVVVHDLAAVDQQHAAVVALGGELPDSATRNPDQPFEQIGEMVFLGGAGDRRFGHDAGSGPTASGNVGRAGEPPFVICVPHALCRGLGGCGRQETGLFGAERQRVAGRCSRFEAFGAERQRTVHAHRFGVAGRLRSGLRAVERVADFGSGGGRRQCDLDRLGEQVRGLRRGGIETTSPRVSE